MAQWFNELWFLTLEAAPWLLLGLVIAALIQAFSDRLAIARYLSGESLGATVRAALIGAPLPLCSCGVVPAVLSLRSAGAGRGPTMAFLVATPETGPDSVTVSYGLLGPVYAIARPIAAITGAIATGLISGRFAGPEPVTTAGSANDSCCSPKVSTSSCCDAAGESKVDSCCDTDTSTATPASPGTGERLARGFDYAFGQVLLDIVPWMLFGLLVAATAVVLIPDGFFDQSWGLVASYLLMAVIGIPMYVCATASTPIAAGLLVAGMSPGAALVFLLAGPATNIGSLGILKGHFGTRLIGLYLVCVIGIALIAGIALDLLWRQFNWSLPQSAPAGQVLATDWLSLAMLVVLIATISHAYWHRYRKC